MAGAALVFCLSAMVCVVVGRVAIQILRRAQALAPVRYEDCAPLLAYQQSKASTPTMGGVIVLAVGIGIAAVAGGLSSREGWLVCAAIVGLGAIGLCDDVLKFQGPNAVGLRSVPKLVSALAIGGVIGLLSAPPSRTEPLWALSWASWHLADWGWILFAMVVLAGCAHAVNLTDGMDGLASGCAAIALAALGWWTIEQHVGRPLMWWCASLSGACVGFLWFNSFPASVFLGDVGALGLGGALGAISLLTHSAWWLVLVGGVFVAEACSVMLQVASYKWRGGRRIFRVAPLHHHFHLAGTVEPKLIVRFWITGMLLAMAGLALRRAP